MLEEEGCYERARVLGERALLRLRALADTHPELILAVRGAGLMIGVELAGKEAAESIQARCLQDGLIVLLCGPGENILRLIPPLTVSDAELDLGISILADALRLIGSV